MIAAECPDFQALFATWLTSRDEMAVAAATVVAQSSTGMEDASHLLAAGFAAGYVTRVRHELEKISMQALENFQGACQ